MKLEDIKLCPCCSSNELTLHPNYTFETIRYDKLEEEEVTLEVLECLGCSMIYWYEDNRLCRQFNYSEKRFTYVPQINDDRIHLIDK